MSLKVFLLGQFKLKANDQNLNLPSRPAQSILAYLVLHPGVEHRREKLAALFWPETSDANARSYLRQALWRIRKSFTESSLSWRDYLQANDITIKFNPQSDYWLDAAQLLSAHETMPASDMIEVIKLYKGELLPGFYEDWIVLERDHINSAYQQKMERLLDCLVEEKQWDDVLTWSENWILHGYSPEPAYRAIMLAHAAKGDQSQVIATFQRCSEALQRELGVSPSLETQDLFEDLQAGKAVSKYKQRPSSPTKDSQPPFLLEDRPEVEERLFVARKSELIKFGEQLNDAVNHHGRVVFITGEAGSGKTSLLQECIHRIINDHQNIIVANGFCNAQSGIGDPYLPFREILELLTGDVESRWQAGAISNEHARLLWNLLPQAVQAILDVGTDLVDTFLSGAALLNRAMDCNICDRATIDDLILLVNKKVAGETNPNLLQQNLFNQYTKVLQFLAQKQTIVLILDDLQWADLGSISLLFHLGRQISGCKILIIGTYRPEEIALEVSGERHPLLPVINELQRIHGDIFINLEETDNLDFIKSIIDSEPNLLNPSFKEMLYKQTRGHPLFTIELLRGLQERGDLIQNEGGSWIEGPDLAWDTMPGRVEAVIAERIGRLSGSMQQTLRIASVEGETFTAEILAQVQEMDNMNILSCLSSDLERKHRLVKAQSIQRVNGQLLSMYKFQHILFQKYLYNSLDEIEKVHLHERVGSALENLYKDSQEKSNISPALARHFHEAKLLDKEIDYLHQAGERALLMSAYQEAINHLTRSLDLLMTYPETRERMERELALQLCLGQAMIGPVGYGPEVEALYIRARELSEILDQKNTLCQVLHQLSVLHFVIAEYQVGLNYGKECLSLAEEICDPLLTAIANWHLGFISFNLGNIKTSLDHLKPVTRLYKSGQFHRTFVALRGSDAGISAMAYEALCLWILGYKDQANKIGQEVIDLANEINHPFSIADALCFAGCWLSSLEYDTEKLLLYSTWLRDIALENNLAGWSGSGITFYGEALTRRGQIEEGINEIRKGIENQLSVHVRSTLICSQRSIAEALLTANQFDKGLDIIDEALELLNKTGEHLWEAELFRIQAQLLLEVGKEKEAENSFKNSIDIAGKQEAKSFELRSTIGLANLWHKQGRQVEACQALKEITAWFTEGFSSIDYQNAKSLLHDLEGMKME